MKYRLQDLIDMEHFQNLQDRLNEIHSFPSSIIDNDGNILTATSWQDVCTQFHRTNEDSERECIKSDQYIRDHLHEADPAVSYRCPHGLVDNATPIIIDGIHYGNFFTGQFFLEEPDMEFFRTQAQKYGFDEDAYLKAVQKVPIWTQEQLNNYLFFIKGLISVISESGLKKLKEMENRKRIETSEKRHRSILKFAMDGYWLTDTEGRLLEVNDAYCRMSGYSEDELLNMCIPDLEAVEKPQLVAKHLQKVVVQGSDRFESKHRRKDGSVFEVEVSIQFHQEEGGRCVCFLRDITERIETEKTLRVSEKRYRTLFENMTQGVFYQKEDGVLIDYNNAALEMFGLTANQFIGKTSLDPQWKVINEDGTDLPGDKHPSMVALQTGKPVRDAIVGVYNPQRKKYNWLVVNAFPQFNEADEKPNQVFVTLQDITDRREAERQYQMLFKEMLDGFALHEIICDAAGQPLNYRFLAVNPAFEKMTGLKANQIMNRTVLDVLPGIERHWVETYGKVALSGEPAFFENFAADIGKHFQVTAFRPAPNQFACIFFDITERKKAEEALNESKLFLDNMSDIAYRADDKGTLVWVNSAAERITGLSRDDLIGKPFLPLFIEADHPSLTDVYKRTLMGESLENTLTFNSGVSCHFTSLPNRNANADIVGTFGVARDITAQLNAQRALQASEKRLKKAQEMARIGNWEYDISTGKVWGSEETFRIFGFERNTEFLPLDEVESCIIDVERVDQALADLIAKNKIYDIEYKINSKIREGLTHIHSMADLVCDAEGNPLKVDGVIQDITEYRRMEEERRQSEETYRNLLDNLNAGVVVHAPDTSILIANATACSLLGLTKDQMLGKEAIDPQWQFVREDGSDMPLEEYPVSQVLFTDEPLRNLVVGIKRSQLDDVSWVMVNGFAVLNGSGQVEQVIISFIDITEHKRAEESLKESEAKYRSMMEAMDDAVYICSGDLRIEYMNKAMIESIGYDATGEPCHKVMHGIDEKCPWCVHDKIMSGQFIKTEVVSPKANRTYHVSNSPIFHLHGAVSKLTIFRDITDQKKVEERLLQAQKMEAIGSLAGGIAHDLNNILFPISGFSEMLLDEIPPDNPAHESIEQIYKSAKRGSDLVKQILAFSRQSNLQKLPIRIQPVLKEVLKLVRATIPKNIELTSHIEKDYGRVLADPTQIHQIAMNLITNAYHAVEEKGGSINIELKETEFGRDDFHDNVIMPGKYVVLCVSDTGTGIDQALMDKIFDPYFTTKELGKGTGLGLSVVHGIVKEHGGDIQVYSEFGKGTTFNVYLPLLENASDSRTAAVTREHPTGCESILLVDDEEPITQMVQMILERLGYKVTARMSSPDALDAFKANPSKFDLVISDRGMPNMTGEQLARELILIKPEIPIILCTGFSDESDEKRTKNMGIKGILKKPVATADLAEMVRKVLDESTCSTQE